MTDIVTRAKSADSMTFCGEGSLQYYELTDRQLAGRKAGRQAGMCGGGSASIASTQSDDTRCKERKIKNRGKRNESAATGGFIVLT